MRPPQGERSIEASDSLAQRLGRWLLHELRLSLILVAVIGLGYALISRHGVPAAGGALGHTLGVIGFVLMLCTETLYTLRKRSRRFAFGRMSLWLQAHIVTGIVGPFLVLLHAGAKFHGLAGVLTLLTILMVLSGFLGRYLFTAIPRSLEGAEAQVRHLEAEIVAADRELRALGVNDLGRRAVQTAEPLLQGKWRLVLGRHLLRWRLRRQLRRMIRDAKGLTRGPALRLIRLVFQRFRLRMQIESLATARQLLALWHIVHIPLGGALFALAFIHIVGAMYYSTFLKW